MHFTATLAKAVKSNVDTLGDRSMMVGQILISIKIKKTYRFMIVEAALSRDRDHESRTNEIAIVGELVVGKVNARNESVMTWKSLH